MSYRRPPRETIVDSIKIADKNDLNCLARFIKATQISPNNAKFYDVIIDAWLCREIFLGVVRGYADVLNSLHEQQLEAAEQDRIDDLQDTMRSAYLNQLGVD